MLQAFSSARVRGPDFPEARDLVFTSMRGVALTYALTDRDPTTEPHLDPWKRLLRRALL